MKLPDCQRVIYKHSPLIEVVGQLRFPTILKINNQEPYAFQEKIRFDYPNFKQSPALKIPQEIAALVPQIDSLAPQHTTYNFLSENYKWQLSLNQETLTLATLEYKGYEEFKEKFAQAIDFFEEVYQPYSYIRLGLRYKDLILRSKLKIEKKPWSALIDPQIASELHSDELSASIRTLVKNLEIELETGRVNFNHGLVISQDPSKGDFQEPGYLFDADFFVERKINKGEIWNVFDSFNQTGGKLFRWSITDELHSAMEPQPID
jgi:uncharacterized protein (TIGR04255 family)